MDSLLRESCFCGLRHNTKKERRQLKIGKKWAKLCLAGCLGIVLGIAGAESTPVYAKGKKLLTLESTVFDLQSSTSGLTAYGYVSDIEKHPVEGAKVTIKSNKGGKGERGNWRYRFLGLWWT